MARPSLETGFTLRCPFERSHHRPRWRQQPRWPSAALMASAAASMVSAASMASPGEIWSLPLKTPGAASPAGHLTTANYQKSLFHYEWWNSSACHIVQSCHFGLSRIKSCHEMIGLVGCFYMKNWDFFSWKLTHCELKNGKSQPLVPFLSPCIDS